MTALSFRRFLRGFALGASFTLLIAILPSCSLFTDSPSIGETSGANSQGITLAIACVDTATGAPAAPCRHETSTVTVTFSGLPGNPNDEIRISAQGSSDSLEVAHQYTGGATHGTKTFTKLPAAIPLVARAFIQGTPYPKAAESPGPALTLVDDAQVVLSCAPAPGKSECDRSSPLTVTYSHFPGNTNDNILITGAEGIFVDHLSVDYTLGKTDGVVTVNIAPGAPKFPNGQPLVARAYEGTYGGPQIAVSNSITLGGPDTPKVTVDCGVCNQADPVRVTYSDLPGFLFDSIVILPEGQGLGAPAPQQYTNPPVDGTLTFTGLPANDWLVAVAYRNASNTVVARSDHFRLTQTGQPSLAVSCSTPGQAGPPDKGCTNSPRTASVTVQFADMPGYYYDAITFAPAGSSLDKHFYAEQFTYREINGARTFTGLPSGVSMVARAFKDVSANGTTILEAESQPFTLSGGGPQITLTCDSVPCRRSSKVKATYSGFPGYLYDFISFYKAGSELGNGYTPIQYTIGVVDGELTFTDLPSGQLVARGFKNGDFGSLVKESAEITILPDLGRPPTITIGCAPYCRQGEDIVATYSNLQTFYYSSLSAYTYPQNAIRYGTLQYQYGSRAGTIHMGTLPVGNYTVASDMDSQGVPFGRSLPFSVGPSVPVCGDGVRDPSTEQCDDGNLTPGDSCSATCTITAVDVAPRPMTSGTPPLPGRTLGEGRHPMAAQDESFAVTFVQAEPTPTLSMALYSSVGVPRGAPIALGNGTSVLSTSNPVIAALPGSRYAAAWTDLAEGTMGDGDEQGVALRLVDPAAAPSPVTHANTNTDFNQFDPDIVFTGTDVVVAWVDESNFATKRDVRYRLFAPDLTPRGAEAVLAGTTDSEADIALATFAGSWAAAWRVATDAGEVVRVHAGGADWSVGPFLPGPAGVKPALIAMDDTHLLLVTTQGVDAGNTGVANGTTLRAAVLDMSTPGTVVARDFGMMLASPIGANRPTLAHVGKALYLAWEGPSSFGPLGPGQHVWMIKLTWDGTTVGWSGDTALPRDARQSVGDQGHAALLETGLAVEGGVLAGWDDLGMSFGNSKGEVVVQLMGVPW